MSPEFMGLKVDEFEVDDNSSTHRGDGIIRRLVGTRTFPARNQESMETRKMSL